MASKHRVSRLARHGSLTGVLFATALAGTVVAAGAWVVDPGVLDDRAQQRRAMDGAGIVDAAPTDGGSVPVGVSASAVLARRHGAIADRLPAPKPQEGQGPASAPEVGESEAFWAFDFQRHAYYRVPATLQSKTDDSWIYVQDGLELPVGAIDSLRTAFDDAVLPAVRDGLGPEPSPGIDAETAITVFLLDIRDPLYYQVPPGTYFTGYFDPVNQRHQVDLDREDPRLKSNEREMIYVDAGWPTDPTSLAPKQTLAHELAHLVQWSHDAREMDWMVEGLSELAVYLCGLGHPREHVLAFLSSPDVALVRWDGAPADYGKSYVFFLYAYEQAGEAERSWLRQLVRDTGHGMPTFAAAFPVDRTPAELLRDLALALQLDDPEIGDGRFAIRSMALGDPGAQPDAYPKPRRAPTQLLDSDLLAYEYEPWSVRVHAFDTGRMDLELELTPYSPLCVGAARLPSASDGGPLIDCLEGGTPTVWHLAAEASSDAGGPVVLAVANGSDLPSSLSVEAVPRAGARSLHGRSLLPVLFSRR